MSVVHVSDGNFKKEVLESKLPVMVDFWAEWCGPCKMIAPHVEECAKAYADKIKVVKLDVDNNPKTATQYGIMSIPTLVFFRDGKIMEQSVGAMSKADIKRKIEEQIGSA